MAEQTSSSASDAAVEVSRRLNARRATRPYAILGGVVVIVLGAYFGVRFLSAGRESTDDAQVATDMVPIGARVGGSIKRMLVTDHQTVTKGDLLAEIDPTDYQNKLEQARADVQAAEAEAASADAQTLIVTAGSQGTLSAAEAALFGSAVSVAGADAQIEAAKAAVERSQAEADKAQRDLERAQSLRKDDAIPQVQVDAQMTAASAARAAVAQAKAMLAVATEAKRGAQSRTAEAKGRVQQSAPVEAQLAVARARADLAHARVVNAKTSVAQAELNLSYTRILAPQSGHISKLAVHEGQLVGPSQTVANLLPATTYVIANFKETQVGQMRPGQRAEIALDAYPGRSFPAEVDKVAYGTGAQFSLLPPDNASGNFVKVVQRVPVKLKWASLPNDLAAQAGLSADVTVFTK